MKKVIIVSMILTMGVNLSIAQVKGGDDKFDKLFDLFVLEKYEDCAYKAENYTMNDKYRKDPEPYLYLSMCFFKISKTDFDVETYKDPLKDALKYAYKFRKKDKDTSIYNENKAYINKLKEAGIVRVRSYYDEEKYRKSAYFCASILKIEMDDDNIRFPKGVYDLLSRNTQGARDIGIAVKNLSKKYSDPGYVPDKISESLLIESFVVYSEYLYQTEQLDSAKATIIFAKELIPKNRDLKNQYNKLHGLEIIEEEVEEVNDGKPKRTYQLHFSEKPGENNDQETNEVDDPEPKKEGVIEPKKEVD